MSNSIFWYDFETTGINPRCDRPLQVAGIRTDEALNEIGEPLNLYCQLSDDILPHPMACQITGITPEVLEQQGLCESEFVARLYAQMAQPGTCSAGYNTLRFDDEVTRYTLYRNFYDPYAREWQGGNSRWDLIDLVRACYALRPDGIVWPRDEQGRTSLRLELLSHANGLEHGQAHDALSDVRATIALARLIREKQPRLYDYVYQLRSKHKVMEQIRLLQPLVHVSGRFSVERSYLSVVLPLAWHPRNRNALIVCDLNASIEPLLALDAQVLKERLYTRRDELAEGALPVPLKLVHINKCPIVAPLKVLREQDLARLHLDLKLCQKRAQQLCEQQGQWRDKLTVIYQEDSFVSSADPEQQLYAGFLGDRDKRIAERVRHAGADELALEDWAFSDDRLVELLFRYRARNFPSSLNSQEQLAWRTFCRSRLMDGQYGAPNTVDEFEQELLQQLNEVAGAQRQTLLAWQEYLQRLRHTYNL